MANTKPQFELQQLSGWLEQYHQAEITELAPLTGGYWSTAYGYRLGEQDLVLRLGESGEGFAIDDQAYRLAGHLLPIPEVIARGEVFDHHFATSVRHFGQFLEDVPVSDADSLGAALTEMLQTLRGLPPASDDVAVWYESSEPKVSWHEWLLGSLADRPGSGTWREPLRQKPELNLVFEQAHSDIIELLPLCPSRGELIHGDLLHQNVLVSEAADEVTGVFSWKCSARGDFLYDIAWCTLWGDWFPVIEASGIVERTLQGCDASELKHAAQRHHCYELQIAASHMGWFTQTSDEDNLARLVAVLQRIIDRGPLAL